MPWCPKCKNEYVKGIKICSDCKVELVESLKAETVEPQLTENMVSILYGPYENLEEIVDNIKKAGIESAIVKQRQEDEQYELFVDEKERDKTVKTIQLFLQAQKELSEGETENNRNNNVMQERYEEYVSAKDKAKEMKSSAIMLMIFGIAGFIVLILMITKVLPFGFGSGGVAIFCYAVMGGFFSLLFGSGIVSLNSSKKMSMKSNEEDSLTKEAKEWANQTFTVENLERVIKYNGDANQMYFIRIDFMKRTMMQKFPKLPESFVDKFIEDKYEELYD
ncbi:MAG: hypothetical protein PUE21_03690 [Lachnospiraceae bacterium]|nr:hypothetical protein [Lachnospiraceae bacterium]